MNTQSKTTLFADDTIITISHPQIYCFKNWINDVIDSLNKCIKAS
jgi:hypothetical protein